MTTINELLRKDSNAIDDEIAHIIRGICGYGEDRDSAEALLRLFLLLDAADSPLRDFIVERCQFVAYACTAHGYGGYLDYARELMGKDE